MFPTDLLIVMVARHLPFQPIGKPFDSIIFLKISTIFHTMLNLC